MARLQGTGNGDKTSSRYVGVFPAPHGKKWRMVIGKKGKTITKYYDTEELAAAHYNTQARIWYGPEARLNNL